MTVPTRSTILNIYGADYEVHYHIHGSYYPGNREEPPEYPVIELVTMLDERGDDILDNTSELFKDGVEERIYEELVMLNDNQV